MFVSDHVEPKASVSLHASPLQFVAARHAWLTPEASCLSLTLERGLIWTRRSEQAVLRSPASGFSVCFINIHVSTVVAVRSLRLSWLAFPLCQ